MSERHHARGTDKASKRKSIILGMMQECVNRRMWTYRAKEVGGAVRAQAGDRVVAGLAGAIRGREGGGFHYRCLDRYSKEGGTGAGAIFQPSARR